MSDIRKWMRLIVEAANPADVSDGHAPGRWYHGTPHAFDQFDPDAGEHDSNHETPAIFLTNDPDLAESYASRERQPMSDSFGWGEMKAEFIDPAVQLIATSQQPDADYLSREAESILNGRMDFVKVLQSLPDIAQALKRLKAQYDARIAATQMTQGANIRPVTVTGRYMHVRMLTDFNAGYYDLFMREAKSAGLAGVLFHDIVDSPSGGGAPCDVLAVFNARDIHTDFGNKTYGK
jgi:hypothetical protein